MIVTRDGSGHTADEDGGNTGANNRAAMDADISDAGCGWHSEEWVWFS